MLKYPGSLHNHTDYSNLRLRDSTNTIYSLIDKAIELGHSVVAITEHETVANAIKVEKYYNKIKQEHPGFKVILGNEIYLCRNGLCQENFVKGEDDYWHFILLAKDAIGHEQIRKLSSIAWSHSYKTGKMIRVPTYYSDLIDIIDPDKGHVVGTTACLGGYIPHLLLKYEETSDKEYFDHAVKWLKNMDRLFGHGNFFLEMQPSRNREQIVVNKLLLSLSNDLNIPYIITTDSHYLRPEDASIHSAFLKAQEGEREVESFYATTYMMNDEEIRGYFDYFSDEQLETAFQNTLAVSSACEDFSLLKELKIPCLEWRIPKIGNISDKWFAHIPALKDFFITSPFEGDKVLALAIVEKLESDKRLQTKEVYDELNSNLETIKVSSEVNKVHWSAYFLNLQKIIERCWEAGTLVGPGRGSGVGFLLLYILDIIQINPLWEETKTFAWRFLNPNRVSVLDIDTDIEGGRRAQVLEYLRETYGQDRVANVVTFGTEKSKSAIQTAARGLDIDVDNAAYISSLIPADRGIIRTLKQCYYGDEEKGFKPIPAFVQAMNEQPELWKVAQYIEGLVCRVGEHAGGVIFVDEDFTKSTALMKVPNGDTVTQFDLHDCEDASLIKMDLLSVECLDKIHTCLDLLCDDGLITREPTLKKTYEKVIGIYNLERDDPKMWEMVHNHKIQSLFQMEKQSGIQGISLAKPVSVNDLAVLNSVIRLMAPEKNAEQPLNMWARYRKDINQWYQEMRNYGLSEDEIEWLSHHHAITNGICESQEGLMSLVQEERLGGNSLNFADKCRKGLAKKIGSLFDECEKEFYARIEEKGCSKRLAHYVWDVLLKVQRGYSFNRSHCLAYSLIALQEMNICYKFPIVYWNCACLITDSGGTEETNEKGKSTAYDKIAQAMGKMLQEGIEIAPPDINASSYTFSPDRENNRILFGLRGITNVGEDLIQDIINNRPYKSLVDFMSRVKANKQAMIALIKGGAFDCVCGRLDAMVQYIWLTCDKKKRLTLQNMPGLMRYGVLPDGDEYAAGRKIYEFNRYLKAECPDPANPGYYLLDNRAIDFICSIGKDDIMETDNTAWLLDKKVWDKFYQGQMDVFRNWIASDKDGILEELNSLIFMDDWKKYAKGNASSWEMESLCFYYHDHELAHVDMNRYGLVDYNTLPEEPVIDKMFKRNGNSIPIYKLYNICGTCIAKNKNKSTVYLLTTTGVVSVRFRREYFSLFDRQIFRRNPDGSKTVIERSWFNRGNMIIVKGMRRGDEFVAKKYNSSGGHQLYHIDEVRDDGSLVIRSERLQGEGEEDEE